jgi:hypothetical protein
MTARPSEYLSWTQGQSSRVVAPPANLRLNGWGKNVRPPFQYLNWQIYLLDQWVQYLDSAIATGTPDQVIRLLAGGEWAFKKNTGVLSWSQAAHLSMAGIPDANNNIPAGNVTLLEGQIAYVVANSPLVILGDTQNGSAVISNVNFTANLQGGMAITGPGIPSGSTIFAIGDTTITISNNATATASQAQLVASGTGGLSVMVVDEETFIPTLTTILIAKRYNNVVYVGVNSSQMILRDNEFKPFMGSGYFDTYEAIAGEDLVAGDTVYISQGPSLDSGRTLGRLYKLDVSYPNHIERGTYAGAVISDVLTGVTVTVCYDGFIKGTSLVSGSTYWADPANVGKLTITKPSDAGQKKIPVAFAVTSTSMIISNGGSGSSDLTQPVFKYDELGNGSGATTVFNLSTIPLNTNSVFVFLNGMIQKSSSYSIVGQVITFSSAPELGRSVSAYYVLAGQSFMQAFQEVPALVSGNNYSINGQPVGKDSLVVYVDGGVISPSLYSLTIGSPSLINLSFALAIGQDIYCTYLAPVASNASSSAVTGIQNLGTGVYLFTSITSNVAKFKKIKAGVGITLDDTSGTEVVISAAASSGGMVAHGNKSAPIIQSVNILTPSLDQRQIWYIRSDGGIRSISIASGIVVGQELIIKGCDDTDHVTIDDTMGTDQNGLWRGQNNDAISYNWNGLSWDEISRR